MYFENNILINLKISLFEGNNVTDMTNLFSESDKIKTINIYTSDTNNGTIMNNKYKDNNNTLDLNISTFEAFNDPDNTNMFSVCDKKKFKYIHL